MIAAVGRANANQTTGLYVRIVNLLLVLNHVLNHPEVGAKIGVLQENWANLSEAAQHKEDEKRSAVARNAV
jgi:hypothetical protein